MYCRKALPGWFSGMMMKAIASEAPHSPHQILRNRFICGVGSITGGRLAAAGALHHFFLATAFLVLEAGVRSAMSRFGLAADALLRVLPFWSTL
jgi:hypothetical protein